ncbi:endonuclease domain-containing protein [Pseudonocardia sp. KRD291]|uniref:endonuclease domain-containing protein n=1 Tax=Pseudonocardia sp. KRD291 TaxID=2792007 RepID=UPI001C49E2F4|nr:hypothetical protein [Pseudonocardia sp. KRD291]MBW0104035.1 hypothetical protein [Pseudonocardia sp. KRD291]
MARVEQERGRVRGWPVAFRGSEAVAAGLVRWSTLRGPRFRRLHPDVYALVCDEPDELLRERAASALVGEQGVLCGFSAANVQGADCAPRGAPQEVSACGARIRSRPGLVVRREALLPEEITLARGMRVTTAVRTGYDLVRRAPDPVEAVVALDALANVGTFAPERVFDVADRHPGARGTSALADAVRRADARSGSPMETRMRLLLIGAGLPAPELQFPVQDPVAGTVVWLDLAYPDLRIGIEYEGPDHLRPERVRRDIRRGTDLVDRDWRIYRFVGHDVLRTPDRTVAMIRRGIEQRRSGPLAGTCGRE